MPARFSSSPVLDDHAAQHRARSPARLRAGAADQFDVLRARWATLNTGGEIDPAAPVYADALARLTTDAQGYLDALVTDRGRTALWPDLPLSLSSGNFSISYTRLRTIALARATKGTTLSNDLTDRLVGALDCLYSRSYNETLPETDNWWFWEIGAPRPCRTPVSSRPTCWTRTGPRT